MKKRPTGFSERLHHAILRRITRTRSIEWTRRQTRHVLELFRDASKHVPAYQRLLQRIELDPRTIRTVADIAEHVPATSKHSYINAYPRTELLWDTDTKRIATFTATSGSTGKPTYFMRSPTIDYQASVLHEEFFRQSCDTRKPTLVIVCFGMGIWIGGLITYNAFQKIASRGYPISIITPGVNIAESLRALRELAPMYEQVIMCGYPPFVKDILDAAQAEGTDLKSLKLRFVFAAEAFTDTFRMHIAKRTAAHPYQHITNIYGTAELGAMAWETPLAGMLRHLASKNKKIFTALFGTTMRIPTLAQYVPDFCAFTEKNGELFVHADSAMPLVQYALGDKGGVFTSAELQSRLKHIGVDLRAEAKKHGITHITELPFVYVYERTDFVVSLYGLNVFPQPVREVLLTDGFARICTGKCTLETVFDAAHNQQLVVHIELAPRIKKIPPRFERALCNRIAEQLRNKNAEYRELSAHIGERALPRLVFWPNGSEQYFARGIKQKWVVKKT